MQSTAQKGTEMNGLVKRISNSWLGRKLAPRSARTHVEEERDTEQSDRGGPQEASLDSTGPSGGESQGAGPEKRGDSSDTIRACQVEIRKARKLTGQFHALGLK